MVSVAAWGNWVHVVGDWNDDVDGQVAPARSDALVVETDLDGTMSYAATMCTGAPDFGVAVAIGSNGDRVVVGTTWGQMWEDEAPSGAADLFMEWYPTYDPPKWHRQVGTPGLDVAKGAAVDAAGGVYVLAESDGDLLGASNTGGTDVFVLHFDPGGNLVWSRALGTPGDESAAGLAVHPGGGVILVGSVTGALDGEPASGGRDVFVTRYDGNGAKLWTRQLGSPADDWGTSVALHPAGGVFLTARTTGDLAGSNMGDSDGALLFLCE